MFNTFCRLEGDFVLWETDQGRSPGAVPRNRGDLIAQNAETIVRRVDLYCDTGSPAFTAKWVPRMPMVAVGVSKRAFSGASFPMRPER